MKRIIKGDLVRRRNDPSGEIGRASFADLNGRWVVWTPRVGRWGAGAYPESEIERVSGPESAQVELSFEPRRFRGST